MTPLNIIFLFFSTVGGDLGMPPDCRNFLSARSNKNGAATRQTPIITLQRAVWHYSVESKAAFCYNTIIFTGMGGWRLVPILLNSSKESGFEVVAENRG